MGLGRTLQTEYPLLHFFTVDLDHVDASRGALQLLDLVGQFDERGGEVDKEYIFKKGVAHISRLSEDVTLDDLYQKKASTEPQKQVITTDQPVCLDIGKVGILDTVRFRKAEYSSHLSVGQVEVAVKAVGVNMKEYATLRGTFNSESLSHEGAGIVLRISSNVTNVAVGDRVAWMGKGRFGNVERFASIHLHKMPATTSFGDMASMPLAFPPQCTVCSTSAVCAKAKKS